MSPRPASTRVVVSERLSVPGRQRFVVIHARSQEVIDDNGGRGYASRQAAKASLDGVEAPVSRTPLAGDVRAERSVALSRPGHNRWVLVSTFTGEVVDDNRGHGWSNAEKALRVHGWEQKALRQRS